MSEEEEHGRAKQAESLSFFRIPFATNLIVHGRHANAVPGVEALGAPRATHSGLCVSSSSVSPSSSSSSRPIASIWSSTSWK